MTGFDVGAPPAFGHAVHADPAIAYTCQLTHTHLMSQLQDVSLNAGERQFVIFRASVLAALSARPELRRLGVLLQGDDGFRLVAVDGVSRVHDLWSWLVANAPDLMSDAPRAAALIIPRTTDGAICAVPSAASSADFDLDVCMVDDRHRLENAGFRCLSARGELLRLPSRPGGAGPTAAVAALLGTLLAEHRDPPPAPMRLPRPARNQRPVVEYETMAMAA
jgi:hypothetical protein